MPISIEMSAIGDPETKMVIESVLRDVMGSRSGTWRISVIGSQLNDIWELKVRGPNTNRLYKLYGPDGQHDPTFVRALLTDSFASPPAPSVALVAPVADAWIRLSNSGGSDSDVRKALQFVTENWSRASDDFSVTRKWGSLSPEEETRRRVALDKETRAQTEEFEKLVWGVAQGPVAIEFFRALEGLPIALKQMAYVKGFRSASEENRVLILCALSRESQNFIEGCVTEFPGDLLMETFRSFLRDPNGALKLRNQGLSDLGSVSRVEVLLGIASLRVPDQNRYIGELTADLRSALSGIADRLIRTLPNESFGRFTRLRLSVFFCLAAANRRDADHAKLVLTSEPDPVVIDVLMLTEGLSALVPTFKQLTVSVGEQQPAYAVAIIDSLRVNAPDVLSGATDKLGSWSKSKSALLAVASQAALLRLQRVDAKDFQKVFLKAARSKENGDLAQWFARNPDFLKCINLSRLPRNLWKSLLNSFLPADPHLARLLIEAKLETSDAERYWQESIESLAKTGAPASEQLLTEVILRELQRGSGFEKRRTLNTDPARSLIQRRYWALATRVDEEGKLQLFDAIKKKVTSVEAVQLLRSGLASQDHHAAQDLRTWITNAFVPYLLRTGALDPSFGQTLDDASFKETLARQLAVAVLADWQYLREFPRVWDSLRKDAKSRLLSHLRGGLQVALLNTRQDSPLHASVKRLSNSLNEWAEKDSPLLESEFKLTLSFDCPTALDEDRGILEDFFRRPPKHPHDPALFLGANPWSFKYLFHEQRNWPKQEILLESICKSFAFIANLRTRAYESAEGINKSVLLDMGIAIRIILADIETEVAGYFAFRDVLADVGLQAVAPRLGAAVKGIDQSGEDYRIVREPGRPGRLRVFSTGLKAADRVLDTATVTQSGAEDDRD
jgi:hypothetical protein